MKTRKQMNEPLFLSFCRCRQTTYNHGSRRSIGSILTEARGLRMIRTDVGAEG